MLVRHNYDEDKTNIQSRDTQLWPSIVKCEMNIDKWREELEKEGLLAEYLYLLDGFVEGFHQGIPKHTIGNLKWFSPPNHNSAVEAKEKIEKSIKKEIESGRMCGPFTELEVFDNLGFFRTSP